MKISDYLLSNLDEFDPVFRSIASAKRVSPDFGDLVNSFFIKFLESHQNPGNIINDINGYLIISFRNHCESFRRRKQVMERTEKSYGISPPEKRLLSKEDPYYMLTRDEDIQMVTEEVRKLEPFYRDAVVVHCMENIPYDECARRWGVKKISAYPRVKRGLDKLRERCKNRL